jgi:hypothetical protein
MVSTEADTANQTLKVTFDHETLTVTPAEEKTQNIQLSAAEEANRTFSVLESITDDGYGHITGYQVNKVTIGKQSIYGLTNPTIESNIVNQTMQIDNSTSVGAINLTSETLKYRVDNSNETPLTYIDLVWGTFN